VIQKRINSTIKELRNLSRAESIGSTISAVEVLDDPSSSSNMEPAQNRGIKWVLRNNLQKVEDALTQASKRLATYEDFNRSVLRGSDPGKLAKCFVPTFAEMDVWNILLSADREKWQA
jgi:hypothetical protein